MHVIAPNLPAFSARFFMVSPGRDRDRGMPDAGHWHVTMMSVPAIGVETLNRYPSAALSTSVPG